MTSDSSLADRAFEPLVAAAKGNALALLMLAEQAIGRGDKQRAYALVQDALALEPENAQVAAIARDLVARTIPDWHVRIVQDEPRNMAFQQALERAVRSELKLLDIGAGSGLLAMMASRAGALHVHSCEMNPAVAAVTECVVAANGFADRIVVHGKNSQELHAEADLGGKADIIVSEIISDDLVSEEVLPALRDAALRLAAPDAQFIPRGGEIRVALAWLADLDRRQLGSVSGFDLSPLNSLNPLRYSVKVGDPALEVRGEHATLFDFDFSSTQKQADRARIDLIAAQGPVNGVIQWFRLQMDDVAAFENGPGIAAKSSWSWNFFPFESPIDTRPGDRIGIATSVTGNRLRLWRD